MRIAIVHYHLRTGGVTKIIEHATSALATGGCRFVVLSGEAPASQFETRVRVVPSLGYDQGRDGGSGAAALAADLEAAARNALGGAPDIWHIHNHSLGKNLALPGALHRLADAGQRLLLQVHDFPEDGRPSSYRRMLQGIGDGDTRRLGRVLYPSAAQVHYAVLNGRDRNALLVGGLAEQQAHLLPNPVWFADKQEADTPPTVGENRLWLYPTRAIRRKNLGELLLWAARAEAGDQFAATRGPDNPLERPAYERWVAFASALGLPVSFEVGERYGGNFTDLLRSAHALVTTSVAEGFGMAFLEPWLVGRPVAGRNLPEITGDFEQAGIGLDHLYRRLELPVEWLGRGRLEAAAAQGLEQVLGAYGRSLSSRDLERTLDAWIRDDRIDFGRLDETMQEEVIERVSRSPGAATELSPTRLEIPGALASRSSDNRLAICEQFGLEQYAQRLLAIYQSLLDAPLEPLDTLSAGAILDPFLAPERLFLLRS